MSKATGNEKCDRVAYMPSSMDLQESEDYYYAAGGALERCCRITSIIIESGPLAPGESYGDRLGKLLGEGKDTELLRLVEDAKEGD